MTRNKIFLAIAMLARIGTGFVSLFVLARALGPTDYGFVATVFAYSSIAALLTDFGFGVQALRDIGAQPHKAGEILAACLRAKNLLVIVMSTLALVVLSVLGLRGDLLVASLLLYGSIIVGSYGDLSSVALRGIGKYFTETYVVVIGAVLYFLIVGATGFYWPEIIHISVAIFATRALQTAIIFVGIKSQIKMDSIFGPIRETIDYIVHSSGVALDTILTMMSTQIDTIFVSSFLGLEAAGLYQVVSRVCSYFSIPTQVLAGVYMPLLSAEHHARENTSLQHKATLEFLLIGLLVGGILVGLGQQLITLIAGDSFVLAPPIWVAFALLVVLRYVSASVGVRLTARGGVVYRVIGQSVTMVMLAVGLPFALLHFGIIGAPIVMIITNTVITLLYIFAIYRIDRSVQVAKSVVGM